MRHRENKANMHRTTHKQLSIPLVFLWVPPGTIGRVKNNLSSWLGLCQQRCVILNTFFCNSFMFHSLPLWVCVCRFLWAGWSWRHLLLNSLIMAGILSCFFVSVCLPIFLLVSPKDKNYSCLKELNKWDSSLLMLFINLSIVINGSTPCLSLYQ